jgi:hypothetical protein
VQCRVLALSRQYSPLEAFLSLHSIATTRFRASRWAQRPAGRWVRTASLPLAAYVLNIELLSISFLFRALSLSLSAYFLISTDKKPRPHLAPLGIHHDYSDSHPILATIPALSMLACTLPANTVECFSQLRSASLTPNSSVLELLVP